MARAAFVLGLDEAGDVPSVLLLPALSSISTRGEMHPLMERLASQFRVVAIDWPGFGTRSRPECALAGASGRERDVGSWPVADIM